MNKTTKDNDPIWKAQDILSRRDHSEFEVRTKLRRKRFSPEEINTAVNWLYERQLLNDHDFARRYIENTLSLKPVGPRWLAAKLKQKGISNDIISEVIANSFIEGKETELAAEAALRWQKSHPSKAADKQKLLRFLQSRGFSFNAINDATDSVTF